MSLVKTVVIGRNEGDRLITCFNSLLNQLSSPTQIVYVDSGSTDNSDQIAKEKRISVICLDDSAPFTAARGRNTGWRYLCSTEPIPEYIQFIDGDGELVEGWLETAIAFLESHPQVAVVCGRRRERYPDASPYNLLADMEWNTPVGETTACGGDALIRVEALQSVNGYNSSLICGEEPEMCIRLRRQGWQIYRLDAEMTLHDMDMLHFGQWWKRSIRGGWAVAEGVDNYGSSPEKYMVREHRSGWLWGLLIPLLAIGLAMMTKEVSLGLFLLYPLLAWRIYQYRRQQRGDSSGHAFIYALFCTLSKFPQMIGQGSYWLTRWQGKTATLIEYKSAVEKEE